MSYPHPHLTYDLEGISPEEMTTNLSDRFIRYECQQAGLFHPIIVRTENNIVISTPKLNLAVTLKTPLSLDDFDIGLRALKMMALAEV